MATVTKTQKKVIPWDVWLLQKAYSEEMEFLKGVIEKGGKDMQKGFRAKELLERFERAHKRVGEKSFPTLFLDVYLAKIRKALRDKDLEALQENYRIVTNLMVFSGKIKAYDDYIKRKKAAREFEIEILKIGEDPRAIDFILGYGTDFKELYRILGIKYR